jgi:PTS system mannose-specific IID component
LRERDGGAPYRAALVRQSQFFNAHPYFASIAIGAAARAELDGEAPERVERMRTALCGPLGALGDRLIWAGWLPACVALGLVLVTLGARGWGVAAFLVLYNVVHVVLRVWGLRAGWRAGLHVTGALVHPLLRQGLASVGPLAALAVGAALPMVLGWIVRRGLAWSLVWDHFLTVAVGAALFVMVLQRLHSRLSGLGLAMIVMTVAVVGGAVWP